MALRNEISEKEWAKRTFPIDACMWYPKSRVLTGHWQDISKHIDAMHPHITIKGTWYEIKFEFAHEIESNDYVKSLERKHDQITQAKLFWVPPLQVPTIPKRYHDVLFWYYTGSYDSFTPDEFYKEYPELRLKVDTKEPWFAPAGTRRGTSPTSP